MSTAKAISVMKAARKERSDEIKVTVTCVEGEKRSAMPVTAAAIVSHLSKSRRTNNENTDRQGEWRDHASSLSQWSQKDHC